MRRDPMQWRMTRAESAARVRGSTRCLGSHHDFAVFERVLAIAAIWGLAAHQAPAARADRGRKQVESGSWVGAGEAFGSATRLVISHVWLSGGQLTQTEPVIVCKSTQTSRRTRSLPPGRREKPLVPRLSWCNG
jgi:hypothetical protein